MAGDGGAGGGPAGGCEEEKSVMSEQRLHSGLLDLTLGIGLCIQSRLTEPALILLCSAIDTAGWLDTSDEESTSASFMGWVDGYLLKAKPLPCTASDLWGARCG